MPSNFKVSSDIDTFLRKQTRQEAADYLGLELPPAVWGQVTGTLSNQTDLQDALDAKAPILDATFTGTTTIPSADITTADFNAGGLGGELSWNAGEKTLDLVTGANGTTIQLGQEVVLYCRNKTATDLVDGQIVKIVGATANTPNIELAIASTTDEAHKTFGVVTQTITANNGEGFITLMGKVRDLSLRTQDGFVEGELVYLSPTVAGALTPTKPLIEVEIGRVLRTGTNNGTLGVSINNEASVYELQQTVPHNTDTVIICNQYDDIQAKYDEAAALDTDRVALIVMRGQYGDLTLTNAGATGVGVDIIGVGNPFINSVEDSTVLGHTSTFKNFTCGVFQLYQNGGTIEGIEITGPSGFIVSNNNGTIEEIKTSSDFVVTENSISGIVKDVYANGDIYIVDNYATVDNVNSTSSFFNSLNSSIIKNCSATRFLTTYMLNEGTIDNCHSTGTGTVARAFGGNLGSDNSGTIKNCTAKGGECFGQQGVDGVTENCTGGDRAFAGSASNLDFSSGLGVQGTYRNCVAGNLSFFGYNNTTNGVKTVEATYINCTAGLNSFGFVNTVGAETHFSGKAINCIGETNAFFNSVNGSTKILNGAILENCIGGVNSFAKSTSSDNEGAILRCRTGTFGASAFSVTGTGKVRLCLDGNYNEVNLG